MNQAVRKKALVVVHWLAGLTAVAGVIGSSKGLYGLFLVWTGELTSVPLLGDLTYPSEAGTGILLWFFEVGMGGLWYASLWVTPAGAVLAVLGIVADRLKRVRTVQLEDVQ